LVDKVQDIPPPVWGSITGDIEDQTDLIDYISSQITTPTLQEVTDVGNTTTNPIIVGGITSGNLYSDGYNFGISDNYDTNYNLFYTPYVGLQITDTINSIYLYQDASISFQTALGGGNLRSDFLTGYRTLQLPDGDGTLALTTDIPTLTSQLTNDGEDGINPFITLADIPPSTGIESVTGTTVNNTDPLNPVVNVPTLDEVLTAGSSSINKIAYFNSSAPGYSQYGSQIGSNGVYGRITVTGGNYNQFQLSTQYLTVESGDSVGRRKVGVLAPEVLGLGNDITGALGYYNPNYFSLKNSSSNSTVTVQSDLVTGLDKIIKFPNASGTLALTSDIPAAGVTSVGLTMPSAFTVTNSPITSSGDIAVTGAGTASQYVRGDGQLATFPSGGGGGSSVNYYLNGSIAASVATYQQMSNTAIIGAGTDFTKTGNGLIAQFLTDVGNPNRLEIPGGAWNFEMFFSMSSGGGSPKFYVELLKYDGTTFTSIASTSAIPETISGGTPIDLYLTSLAVPTTALLVTDRLAIRVYIVDNSGGKTATLHTENSHLCEIITTFSGGVTSLNGLITNTQYFDEGTTGTDFNISSITDTHTFNLPTASATNRGALSTTDWTTFNNKQNASTRRNANNSSNNNINYCGVALGTGVSESSAVWTITRLTIAASGSITTATATNVAWTNRESVIY
jgi:hypothetical protein